MCLEEIAEFVTENTTQSGLKKCYDEVYAIKIEPATSKLSSYDPLSIWKEKKNEIGNEFMKMDVKIIFLYLFVLKINLSHSAKYDT